jgi:hypothetical protein
MKAIFGVMALVLVLAIVGSIAKKQLQAIGPADPARSAALTGPAPGLATEPGTVAEQARSMQERARAETARALDQGVQRNQRSEP